MRKNFSLPDRVIGRFVGDEPGPLFIAIGGMHGNEPAGVNAIIQLLDMLNHERSFKPGFVYRGRFLGLRGNVRALARKQRFLRYDLNRWLNIDRLSILRDQLDLSNEDAEAVALTSAVHNEIAAYEPKHVVLIDLHTTTADGGFFSIIGDGPASRAIALDLHAPVILGMLNGINSTSMHYFTTEQLGIPTTSLVFESGQHEDPHSIDRAVSALVATMRSIGAVHPRDVEGNHDDTLIAEAKGLPKLVRFKYAHPIKPSDAFVMRPGYVNFQLVEKGEVLADSIAGEITCPHDGLILMPLYQAQGEDGFFIVEEL